MSTSKTNDELGPEVAVLIESKDIYRCDHQRVPEVFPMSEGKHDPVLIYRRKRGDEQDPNNTGDFKWCKKCGALRPPSPEWACQTLFVSGAEKEWIGDPKNPEGMWLLPGEKEE